MSLMFQPLRKYAEFEGRARRSEFWLFTLFVWIVQMILITPYFMFSVSAVSTGASPGGPAAGLGLLAGGVSLGLLIPSIAVTFRRLHDTNRSAWWLLIGLVPVIGALVLLVFYFLDGTPGPNRFGPDPKDRGEVTPLVA